MRKKIVLFLLAILLLSLVGVSARARWNTGDPYIPCYEFDYNYNYPKTAIPGGQSVSFDIPTNPCPPVKMIQIGGMALSQQVDADTAVIDQNTPSFQYQCTLSPDQGCCVDDGTYIYVTTVPCTGTFSVATYDAQGLLLGPFSPYQGGCFVNWVSTQ